MVPFSIDKNRPFTPHYDDMVQPWAEVRYHPLWMDEAEIAANAEGTLILTSTGEWDPGQ